MGKEKGRKLHKNGVKGIKIASFWVIIGRSFTCRGKKESQKWGKLHKNGVKGIKIASFWVIIGRSFTCRGKKESQKWGRGMIELHDIYPYYVV